MDLVTMAPRGTRDLLPADTLHWQKLEANLRDICRLYHYEEIRTPIFEHTELFLRGIGDTTDIVEKEMYTFEDRGKRSITLRPEGTASIVRAFLQNKLYAQAEQPVKLHFMGPMFRYDKPQAGRFRQFHQFDIEVIGSPMPLADAEVIALAYQILNKLGLTDLQLWINSVGCPVCRPAYMEELKEYFSSHKDQLCVDCLDRLERNPLRLLDCKNESCQVLTQNAPSILEHLCPECDTHFDSLKALLTASSIPYGINHRLVRGLDYYTKTAFEIQYAPLGAQSAVCGGGRYDGLVEECGGDPTPGVGFAMGFERILLAMEKQGLLSDEKAPVSVFVMPLGGKTQLKAFEILQDIRNLGISADIDLLGRGIKGQMKQANRLNCRWAIMIGENELEQGMITCKDMIQGDQRTITLKEFMDWLDDMKEELQWKA